LRPARSKLIPKVELGLECAPKNRADPARPVAAIRFTVADAHALRKDFRRLLLADPDRHRVRRRVGATAGRVDLGGSLLEREHAR
jgi:hypothetical protein